MTLATTVGPRRKPGRPRTTDDQRQRNRHLTIAEYRYGRRLSIAEVAKIADISQRTVCYWCNLALSYPGERAEALRQLVRRLAILSN